jgi:glycosyltransferase involved in cell wall biosynthesis
VAFLSVILSVFNREVYLRDALDSVFRQTRPPDEIIVIDDGSTDRSAEVARSYGGRIHCVSQANQGIGGARNTGIALAKGDLMALLDSDDIWEDRKMERQCDLLAARPELDLVFCRMKPFASPDLAATEKRIVDGRETDAFNASSMLARRHVYDRTGPYETNLRVGEFVSWFGRAQEKGIRFEVVPEVLLHRRVHTGNSVNDRAAKVDYLRLLKRQLDRRRAVPGVKE